MNTTGDINPKLNLLSLTSALDIINEPLRLAFRLHTNIARHPWARLWYTIRALDISGRGYYETPLPLLNLVTGRDDKSIYRMLQIGKRFGAFRYYKVRGGILQVWLGGLFKVCNKLNLKNWGTVAIANLLELDLLRPLTTQAATQKLQQASKYAANSILKPQHRKIYGSPNANDLIPKQPSIKSDVGEIPFVLHVSEKRAFVSKSFTCYGTSQHAIALELGVNPITVHRHLKAVGVARRQLCQSKTEYPQLQRSLELEMSESWGTCEGKFTQVGYQTTDRGEVIFSDGVPLGAKKQRVNSYKLRGNLGDRIFAVGRKQKKYFMAKCNIYREEMTLKTMWRRRKDYLAGNCHSDTLEKIGPAHIADVLKDCPLPPGNE